MSKQFLKRKECGCVVRAFVCGITTTDKGNMYLIGGHCHFTICKLCKQSEETGNDTLHDMWMSDNITDDFEHAAWKELINYNPHYVPTD